MFFVFYLGTAFFTVVENRFKDEENFDNTLMSFLLLDLSLCNNKSIVVSADNVEKKFYSPVKCHGSINQFLFRTADFNLLPYYNINNL